MNRYRVMLDCEAGTTRFVDDGSGARWEKVYHVITFATYDNLSDVQNALSEALANPTVKHAWFETEDK